MQDALSQRLEDHGWFKRKLAWAYIADGKTFSKLTHTQRQARKRYAQLARQAWRDADWYIERFGR